MLFTESKSLDYAVDGATRTSLLENLQGKGFVPLIRSARLHLYETALAGAEHVRALESALAGRAEAETEASYVRGDLFCMEDYAHFLLFGGESGEGTRAGIVYESGTPDPLEKLDAFCHAVRESLDAVRNGDEPGASPEMPVKLEWESRATRVSDSFKRFAADAAATPTGARGEMIDGWLRTSGMLEDSRARGFLRRLSEAHREGHAATLAAGDESVPDTLLNRLAEVGLLKREILVSCRKDGRSLFRLPSPDAFSVLSGSNATCNECGAAIADERAEEVTVPTSLTATLLQDGAWLSTHLRSLISKLGISDRQIVARPTVAGEVRLMANVCGEAFLFLLHDGDWTTAQARRALDEHAKIESAHLVLIATGKIQEDARGRLREHARRRTQGGRDLELILIEGMDAVTAELQPVFERVSADALAEELWELDTSLGVSAGQLIATRFRLMHRPGAPRNLAASASMS